MKTLLAPDATWVEEKMVRLFTPSGIMTAVALILLSVFILGGSGIEHRLTDGSEAKLAQASISPLLGSH
ncbi:hypothetical protein [uncultured Desulfosarcina sp.]|uniref:hypothetical protein n=1 Tax=uncultured Desulfosarcina sp. TaxID=218289 RepID=UPI0029C95DB5|nr:hypothetical protein [uncultured Desulfosarcina sp.]